jgi:hypothetical protein
MLMADDILHCRSESSLTPSPGKEQSMNLARAVRLTRPRLIAAIIAAVLAAATVLAFSSQAASARPDGPRAHFRWVIFRSVAPSRLCF